MTATIFDIQRCSFVDGPGIRTTVFFKGCNLRCAWCHNPESQSAKPQLMHYRDKCTGCGKCREKCPNGLEKCDFCGTCELYCAAEARRVCGKEYSVRELLDVVLADRAFYESSGGGVTFSGGECLLYPDFLQELLQRCKENGLHTAVDTAGHVPFERLERVLPYTDLFLYDIKSMDPEVHRQYVGADNALILQNLATLLQRGAGVWIRVPLIAGVNDSEAQILAIAEFLQKNGLPERVELLPYHALGESKAQALGRQAQRFSAPEKEWVEHLKALLPCT